MSKQEYKKVPVAKGDEIEVEVSDLAYGGDGVAKFRNFTVFIPYAIPGDCLVAEIAEVKKSYARAFIKKVKRDSPLFTIPICRHFRNCGGCHWINMRYEAQLKYKKKILYHMLEKNAGIKVPGNEDFETYKTPFYYRDRAQYKLASDPEKISLGFYRAKSHEVTDIDRCFIVNEKINLIAGLTREFLNSRKKEVTVYDESSGRGYLRHFTVRVNRKGESLITFVTAKNEVREYLEKYARFIKNRVENVKGVTVNINTEKGNRVFGGKDKVLEGEGFIEEDVKNMKFRLGPAVFFQINADMLEKMAGFTGRHIKKGSRVIDIYGGVGALSVPHSGRMKELTIIEIADECAEVTENILRNNRIDNVSVIHGDAEKEAPRIIREKEADAVILDPPRKGVHPGILKAIKDKGVKSIIYISCNPATFARDLKVLSDMYEVSEMAPMDMFPHTYHIEIMSHIKLKAGKG